MHLIQKVITLWPNNDGVPRRIDSNARCELYGAAYDWCRDNNVKIDICIPTMQNDTLWFETEEDIIVFTLKFGELIN